MLAVALFAAAVGCVALSVLTHLVAPLFVAWVPLLGVSYVLSRPDPSPTGPGTRPDRPVPQRPPYFFWH